METGHLGFVGIGRMGSRMAPRLFDAGHSLTVHDMSPEAVKPLAERGARVAATPAEVASDAEIVFVSLPTPQIVDQVLFGENGVVRGGRVKVVVDLSTTGPKAAAAHSERLRERNIIAMDCPVSGGLAGAANGTLAVMVSGPRRVFDEMTPIFDVFGKPFYIGEQAGGSQMVKVINNLLAAASQAISSEAAVLAVKAGLDPTTLIEVVNASSGRNTATLDKFPRSVLPRTFDFGFATELSLKDVRMCLEEAERLAVPMMVGSAVRSLLAITNATCGPTSDFTSMIKPLEEWAGVEVRGHSPQK